MGWSRNRGKGSQWGESYWAPYVSVAERKQEAAALIKESNKKGIKLNPITIQGRKIATTFWGKAWCENLEAYSDYENRLPRGRSYVLNGSVIDLQVKKGEVIAQVMGSSLYKITIQVKPMPETKWQALVKECAGKIDSMIELLQGKFSKSVMEIITKKEGGLFPSPQEITMHCSCPDSARLCKHIAAVMYGIGVSLDLKPDWLFALRHVDHIDLIASVSSEDSLMQDHVAENALADSDLASLFGIEMDDGKSADPIVVVKPVVPEKKTVKAPSKVSSKKADASTKADKVTKSESATKTKSTKTAIKPKVAKKPLKIIKTDVTEKTKVASKKEVKGEPKVVAAVQVKGRSKTEAKAKKVGKEKSAVKSLEVTASIVKGKTLKKIIKAGS